MSSNLMGLSAAKVPAAQAVAAMRIATVSFITSLTSTQSTTRLALAVEPQLLTRRLISEFQPQRELNLPRQPRPGIVRDELVAVLIYQRRDLAEAAGSRNIALGMCGVRRVVIEPGVRIGELIVVEDIERLSDE